MKISALTNSEVILANHEQARQEVLECPSINFYPKKRTRSKFFGVVQCDKGQGQSHAIICMIVPEIRNSLTNKPLCIKTNIRLCIKNMVSTRCKMIVKSELAKLGIHDAVVRLGEVEIKKELSLSDYEKFKAALKEYGFELLNDKKRILVERIKNVIVEAIHNADELPKIKFSHYLSKKLNYDYTYLSNLFSEVMGKSIKYFIITHKIERAKELLVYNELTLKEIAWKLQYSSVAHLSTQFKNVTGLNPFFFKRMKHKRLIPLDEL